MDSLEILDKEQSDQPSVKRTFNWYAQAWRRYAVGKGRAPRIEFWIWRLYSLAISCAAITLDRMFGIHFEEVGFGPIYILWALATIVPTITVSIRRMQDTGRHGTWILIALLPVAGPIWFLVLTLMPSQDGENAYGPNPSQEVDEMGYRTGLAENIVTFSILWGLFGMIRWLVLQHGFNYFNEDGSGSFWQSPHYMIYRIMSVYIWALEPIALVCIIRSRIRRTWLLWIAGAMALFQLGNAFYEIFDQMRF